MKLYQVIDTQKAQGCLEGIYTFEALKQRIQKFIQEVAEGDYDYYTTGDYLTPETETLEDIIKILKEDYYELKILGS